MLLSHATRAVNGDDSPGTSAPDLSIDSIASADVWNDPRYRAVAGLTSLSQLTRAPALIVGALLVVGFALRVTTLDLESFWRDKVDAVLFARAPWDQLVRAEAEQYDPDDAIARWLDGRAIYDESRSRVGVRLDRYELAGSKGT